MPAAHENEPSTLRRLLTPERRRFLRFSVVGASGVLVNELVLWLCYEHLLAHLVGSFAALAWLAAGSRRLVWSGVAAWAVSVLTNFLLNDRWTWGDRRGRRAALWPVRLAKYYLVATAAMLIQVSILLVLTEQAGLHYLLSNLVGIVAGLAINFVANNLWTFRAAR